jgi:hypothetical protein
MKRGLAPVSLPGLDCLSIIMLYSLKGRMMNSVTVFHTTPHIVHITFSKFEKGVVRKTQPFMCCVVLGPQATHSPCPSSASDVSVVSRTCVEHRYVH